MKNKGISLISLIVTIIIIILIASITIYNGGKMTEQARIKTATDRLKSVASAIVAHEEELGFADVVVGSLDGDYRLLGVADYKIMGLDEYSTSTDMPPIYVYKSGDSINSEKKEYKLKTPKVFKKNGNYEEDDYVYITHKFSDGSNRKNLKVEFDTVKGVNRPLLTEDMMAVKMYFDDKGNVYSEPVIDIYKNDWYDYSSTSPNWANVFVNNSDYYVWIPRFAYRIEDFYLETDLSNIPASAIKVVFLKENTDYMANDEVLPTGYQVHPAFKYEGEDGSEVNIPGFWVAKYNVSNLVDILYGDESTMTSAVKAVTLENLGFDGMDNLESHLLKNTEWAAITYLSFATCGKTDDGTSLSNNPSAVMDLNIRQFVAGGLKNAVDNLLRDDAKNFDIYTIGNNLLDYNSYEKNKFGDAMLVTSKGTSDNSSWFRGTSIKISNSEPFILRGVDDCLFSYSATTRRPEGGAGCRNTLLVNVE